MDNRFGFLARAKPAGLHRLLEKLPCDDAAVVLAGLPPGLSVQVMAYFSEKSQAELLPAMREARQAAPGRADAVVARLRDMLAAGKPAGESSGAGSARLLENPGPKKNDAPPQARPGGYRAAPGAGKPRAMQSPPAPAEKGRNDRPAPWVPRAASGSPINGPALPGNPPPVAGDPFTSPLARAGLMDLIGRAQERLLPKQPRPASGEKKPSVAAPGGKRPSAAVPGKKPAAREGLVPLRSVEVNKTPRVIGSRKDVAAAEGAPPAGARKMDGKAILASILRQADPVIREQVRHDDPALYRELRGRMFYFDDLIYSEDGALARVFTAAPVRESALALKFTAPALRDRVLRVVSPGRAEALRSVPSGRIGMDAIEDAQKRVLAVALRLQAAGRILIDPRDPDLL